MLGLLKTGAWLWPRRRALRGESPRALSHGLGVLLTPLPERFSYALWQLGARATWTAAWLGGGDD